MHAEANPVVVEVVAVEPLPVGSVRGDRRLVVGWSDGTQSTAIEFFSDEILVSEGDLVGLTAQQVRSLLFRRDRDYLQRID